MTAAELRHASIGTNHATTPVRIEFEPRVGHPVRLEITHIRREGKGPTEVLVIHATQAEVQPCPQKQ